MALLMTDPLNVPSLLLGVDASGSILMSFWKPVLPLIILGAWAWVVASVYDKHAARFFLAREKWNIFHLVMGTLALAAAFLMPVPGHAGIAAGLGAMIVILVIDLVAYAVAVSRDDRVPEQFKIRVDVLQKMAASRAEKRKTKSAGAAKLVVRFPDKSTMPVPEAESPEMAVRSAAEMVYLSALAQRASQIEIVPSGKDQSYAVRMLVDGVGIAGDTMPAQNAIRVMDWWKSAAKLDVADRRKKLQGLATIEHAGGKRTIRVTSIGVQGGMRVEILFDPDTAVRRPAKDLGLLDNQM
ncbi:MAG: hypothetical protein K2X32_11670, partial [Phycisphaerales bacterium]|nr:hypothetical protein [Phycisphaerales bacterium]